MQSLPAEVISGVLDQLDPRCRDSPPSTSRRNPWARPQPYRPDHIDTKAHYASFRLVSKRFSELAAPYLFRSIGLRFNRKSFERLDRLAQRHQLARHVRKFVYLMPYVYEEGTQSFDAFRNDKTLGLSHKYRQILFEEHPPYYYTTVLKEQKELVQNGYDLSVLKKAIKAFVGLQHVQLLAIMVHKDIVLRNLASSYDNWEFIDCRWIPACKHATETLLLALGHANSSATAFSSPTMSPQSLLHIGGKTWERGSGMWSRLTYLEVTFDERPDRSYLDTSGTFLTGHHDSLAGIFKRLFRAATSLTTLYIRFTPGMPARLPLEDVLHGFVWPNLRVLGIGSWMLQAEELINAARRHKETLRGLRLNEVYLLDGDLWKTVVTELKENGKVLEWVSLQEISYEREYVRKQAYIETYSDTSSDYDYDGDDLSFDALSIRSRASNSSTSATNNQPHNDTQDDDVMYGNVFMTTSGNAGASSSTWPSNGSSIGQNSDQESTGSGRVDDDMEDLEDDGRKVSQAQRKHWERWIIGKHLHTGERYTRPL